MMAYNALKRAWKNTFLPIQSFDRLPIGTYTVRAFKLKDTKFGKRVFVDIDDFCVVLPPRFSENIHTQDQIVDLNKVKMRMIYKGKDEKKNNLVCVKFKKLIECSTNSSEEEEEQLSPKKMKGNSFVSLTPRTDDSTDASGTESDEEETPSPPRKRKTSTSKKIQNKHPKTFV